jgi:chromosome partitioning protein
VIVTVTGSKGGIGKTLVAFELAAALGAVLVDCDWHAGGATRMWGYRPLAHTRAPLLDALEAGSEGKPPRPRVAEGRPDLVPSHPALAGADFGAERVSDCLVAWASEWGRLVVCDTAPGANEITHGALVPAQLVVCPAVLHARELDALEETVEGLTAAGYRVVVIPNMLAARVPGRHVERLAALADPRVVIGPSVSLWRRLPDRARRRALVLDPTAGVWARQAAAELREVARAVASALAQPVGEVVRV